MGAPSSTSFIIPSTLFSLQTALAVCTSHCILKWHACHCLPRSHVWHFHSKVFTVEYELKIHRITAEKRKWKILPLEKERQNTLHCRTAQKQSRRYGCSSSTQSRMLSAFTHSGEMSEFSEAPVSRKRQVFSVQVATFCSVLSPCYMTVSPSVAAGLSYK